MKFLSASLIVAAGVAIIISSQQCAAAIMKLGPQYSTAIAHTGITIGVSVIVVGILGWAFLLLMDWIGAPAQHRRQEVSA